VNVNGSHCRARNHGYTKFLTDPNLGRYVSRSSSVERLLEFRFRLVAHRSQ
jgi:hypothetical protein